MGSSRIQRLDQHHPHAITRGLAAIGAAALLAGCNGGTVDRHALKQDAGAIASLATEGELLANDVSKGASTTYFARVQSDNLRRQAANLADALGSRPTSPGIEPKVRKAGKLAAQVAEQLDRLHHHPVDRTVAKSVQHRLSDLSDEAEQLAK
jgi:hypothetical protein